MLFKDRGHQVVCTALIYSLKDEFNSHRMERSNQAFARLKLWLEIARQLCSTLQALCLDPRPWCAHTLSTSLPMHTCPIYSLPQPHSCIVIHITVSCSSSRGRIMSQRMIFQSRGQWGGTGQEGSSSLRDRGTLNSCPILIFLPRLNRWFPCHGPSEFSLAVRKTKWTPLKLRLTEVQIKCLIFFFFFPLSFVFEKCLVFKYLCVYLFILWCWWL